MDCFKAATVSHVARLPYTGYVKIVRTKTRTTGLFLLKANWLDRVSTQPAASVKQHHHSVCSPDLWKGSTPEIRFLIYQATALGRFTQETFRSVSKSPSHITKTITFVWVRGWTRTCIFRFQTRHTAVRPHSQVASSQGVEPPERHIAESLGWLLTPSICQA